jgi:hypothetical protein
MESNPQIKMWTPATIVMVVLMLIGGAIAGYRMLFGLGAATNMNDGYPWAFWLGLDVLGGVAMAAGGFIIACAVYLFNWKRYYVIVRPAPHSLSWLPDGGGRHLSRHRPPLPPAKPNAHVAVAIGHVGRGHARYFLHRHPGT